MCNDQFIAAAGGVLFASVDGALSGAIGVSGDTSGNDEACALAAMARVGATPMVVLDAFARSLAAICLW